MNNKEQRVGDSNLKFNATTSNITKNEEGNMLDIDRMVNEGLGGGQVTIENGYIGDVPPGKLYMEQVEDPAKAEE
ncbi:hypothetical protein D3C76_1619230 [compost metagenome]